LRKERRLEIAFQTAVLQEKKQVKCEVRGGENCSFDETADASKFARRPVI